MTNPEVRDQGSLPREPWKPREPREPWKPREPREPREYDLAALRGDCARMVPHWAVPVAAAPRPVPPSRIHGVMVPRGSARLLDAMDGYGERGHLRRP